MLKAWKRPVEAAVKSEFAPVVILLLFSLVVGVLLAPAYGVNWDESADAEYGRYALRAYTGGEVHWDWYHHRKYYGPAYFMAQEWASRELAVGEREGASGPAVRPPPQRADRPRAHAPTTCPARTNPEAARYWHDGRPGRVR